MLSVFYLFAGLSLTSATKPNRPHIILCVIDDVGWTDVGWHNGSGMLTPFFDSLASSGVELMNYYVQPVCSPTRSAFMSGRYPHHTGMQHSNTLVPATKARLPPEDPTIAELLGTHGWDTHAVGKWHLGYASWKYTPTGRGFQSHVGFYQGMEDYYIHNFSVPSTLTPFPLNGYDFFRNMSLSLKDNGTYGVDIFDAEITRVLSTYVSERPTWDTQRAHPLFFYVAHQIVHIPLEAPSQYIQKCTAITDTNRRIYCAMMAALDDSISRMVSQLQSLKLWNDTLLVVTTDNGGMVDYGVFPASAGCNYPLRAGKGTMFQGGVKGVAVLQGGDNVIPRSARGTKSQSLMHAADWASTFMAITNTTVPTFDGFDMWDSLTSSVDSPRTDVPININWHLGYPNAGHEVGVVNKDGWKLILSEVLGKTMNYDGWYPPPPAKPVPPPENPTKGRFLFNVVSDPFEQTNLYQQRSDIVQEMMALLAKYNATYVPPQPNFVNVEGLPQFHDGVWAPFLD